VACAAARRWPDRVRVVVQRGEPGMNPKINQLVTLQAAAQYDLLVVSDSNVRVEPGYLHEIAALFEDPEVGLVTHAMVGAGAESLGSWLEALYLDTVVSAAVIAAQRVLGKSYVVGKSLAMRKADLVAMGGFYAFKDLLAEDFAMGRAVESVLGLRVAHGKRPVRNVTVRRSAEQTFGRFERWSVMQRQAAGTPTYFCQILLHPTVLALLGFVLWPTPWTAAAAAALGLAKLLLDASTVEALGEEELSWRALAALPLKDLFAAGCFAMGLVKDTVDWRGHQLRVLPGTRIERPADEAGESRAPSAA